MQRFDPPTSPARQTLATSLFVLLLGATTAFLWTAHTLPLAQQIAAAACKLLAMDVGVAEGIKLALKSLAR